MLVAATVLIGIGWVSWRRQRGMRTVRTRNTRWRRPAAAAAVLAVAAGAGLLLVPAQEPARRFALRTDLAVPVDPRAFPSPLSDYRKYVGDDAAVPLFTVTGTSAGDRLRLAALDAYDGQTFTATAAEGPFARIGATRPAALPGTDRSIGVTVDGWAGPWLPTIGDLTSIGFGTDTLTDGFRYSGAAMSGLVPAGVATGTSWQQSGVVSSATSAAAGDPLVGSTWPQTAPIPDALRVAAGKFAAGATAPADQLAAMAQALASTGYYSSGQDGQLRSPSGHGLNRLLAMVDGTGMVGDAEQYAALMAVLARALGIPARVVVGFEVPAVTAAGPADAVQVTGADLTAWVEVPLPAGGLGRLRPDAAEDPQHPGDRAADAGRPAHPGQPAAAGRGRRRRRAGRGRRQPARRRRRRPEQRPDRLRRRPVAVVVLGGARAGRSRPAADAARSGDPRRQVGPTSPPAVRHHAQRTAPGRLAGSAGSRCRRRVHRAAWQYPARGVRGAVGGHRRRHPRAGRRGRPGPVRAGHAGSIGRRRRLGGGPQLVRRAVGRSAPPGPLEGAALARLPAPPPAPS